MKSKRSKISKKTVKVGKAVINLIEAILDEPKVQNFLGATLIIFLIIGAIGLLWLVAAIFFLPFGNYGVSYWLRDFVVACPWLAFIWFLIGISSAIIWTMKKDPKQQTTEIKA